jgi:hypothetical protein
LDATLNAASSPVLMNSRTLSWATPHIAATSEGDRKSPCRCSRRRVGAGGRAMNRTGGNSPRFNEGLPGPSMNRPPVAVLG